MPDHPAGNYQLTYDRVSGVAHQPVEITTFNFPVFPTNRANSLSGYINDRWQVGRRLTLNLGVRFDYDHSFLPEQTKTQGQFGNAGTFAKFEGNTWKDWAPRFGVAFDVTGDGKTVVKGTYGIYNTGMADTFAQTFNQNAVSQTHLPLARSEPQQRLRPGRGQPRPERPRLHQHHGGGQQHLQPGPAAAAAARSHGGLRP